MADASERLSTAREAGREVRGVLGPLVSALEQYPLGDAASRPRMAERLARIVGELYAVEVGDPEESRDALDRAVLGLNALLDMVRAHAGAADMAATLARSLARVHPPLAALDRSLGADDDEAVVPLLLSRRRNRTAPPPADAPSDDRRVETRLPLEVDIGFASDTNFYSGFSGDVSDGGLFVATYDVQPVGTLLSVSFVLPSGEQVTAKGRVQWTSEPHRDEDLAPGMGVAFEQISDEALESVRRFLAQREPIFHPA